MITNIDLKTIRECSSFNTFLELFQAIARKITQGYECLMSLGWKKILPLLRGKNPMVNEVILEDALLEAIEAIIFGLEAIEPYGKYTWDDVSIGLLLRICKNKIIDNTSRSKHENVEKTLKVEDWNEYERRILDFASYCHNTTFYNVENINKFRESFLKTLTEREREVYILHYEEEKTVSEISELLDISPATVYRILEKIKIKIKIFKEKIRKG